MVSIPGPERRTGRPVNANTEYLKPNSLYSKGGKNMPHDSNELCNKIKSIYPEIGECDINVKVDFDAEQDAYVVDLEQGEHKLKTYLEHEDADACMDGKQCVNLGVDIAQLKDRINEV
jgi:hypothetical protein